MSIAEFLNCFDNSTVVKHPLRQEFPYEQSPRTKDEQIARANNKNNSKVQTVIRQAEVFTGREPEESPPRITESAPIFDQRSGSKFRDFDEDEPRPKSGYSFRKWLLGFLLISCLVGGVCFYKHKSTTSKADRLNTRCLILFF